MEKDFYKVLGISKTASADEIKKAYRKLALEYHPDRNKTKEGDKKFKEVTEAYEVLSDPSKRQTYDQFGSSAFEQGGGPQGPFGAGFGGQQSGGPFRYTYTNGGFSAQGGPASGWDFGGFSDPFEIFEQFFGGGSPFGQRRSTYSLTIDFMEAVKGAAKTVSIDGKNQTINIPKGVDDGTRIRFGNYDIVVRVKPHRKFKRNGQDIYSEEEISFAKAVLGDTLKVETVQDAVQIKIPPGTQPDTLIRLRGKGMPSVRGTGHGDHYVQIKVVIPKNLTAKQKELLRQFENQSSQKHWF